MDISREELLTLVAARDKFRRKNPGAQYTYDDRPTLQPQAMPPLTEDGPEDSAEVDFAIHFN